MLRTTVGGSSYDYYLESLSLQLLNICEEKNIDKARFYQKINFLYENGCLYDVLFSQNKEGDTLLHVAIKKNDVDLTKEVLRILKRPYNSNNSYKYRYFKDKEESEKPLSKVINTKNREKKDVITLLIEGDNPECISAVFKYLIRENFNRKNEEGYAPLHEAMRFRSTNAVSMLLESENVEVELRDESLHKAYNYVYDEEITQLFINYYDNKINDLHKRLVDSNRKLAQTEHNLSKRKSIFAYSGVASFFAQISKVICDIITERIPLLNNVLSVIASPPGLMVYLIHCTNEELLKCKEKNSSLKEELNSCIREREQLENKLYSFQKVDKISKQLLSVSSQLQDYKEENEILKEGLYSFRESCSTQMNSVFTQQVVPGRDNVFNSPSTNCTHL